MLSHEVFLSNAVRNQASLPASRLPAAKPVGGAIQLPLRSPSGEVFWQAVCLRRTASVMLHAWLCSCLQTGPADPNAPSCQPCLVVLLKKDQGTCEKRPNMPCMTGWWQ